MMRYISRFRRKQSRRWFSYIPRSEEDFVALKPLFKNKKGLLIDCDGVLYHGNRLLPGAKTFLDFVQSHQLEYLFLTNSSYKSQIELAQRMDRLGVSQPPSKFLSALMSTAAFLSQEIRASSSKTVPTCFTIGGNSLRTSLKDIGLNVLSVDEVKHDINTTVDYVVVGETARDEEFNFTHLNLASNLVLRGAKLIGTNIDVADRIGENLLPGTGALVKPIEAVSGKRAMYLGKPSAFMVNKGMDLIGLHKDDCIMIGDRMDTDIHLAAETGMTSILVLSGVTKMKQLKEYSFQPTIVLNSVEDIPKLFE